MRWTLTQVADAVAGKPGHGLDPLARLAGVSIDSRTLRPGELFVAIHGPVHDGHDYVAAALENGAVAAVVAGPLLSKYPGWLQDRCITVPDTLTALHELARAVRKEWGRKVCGITGSVGKTTTKEILAALLGAKLRVLKSEGNFNNEYGLPLTLFRLEETYDVAVLEMGMSFPGELKRLAAIALPDVAIELRVTPAHLMNFSSVEEIALAKRELVEGLHGPLSLAVLNADDPRVAAMAAVAPGKVIFYGIEKPAEYQAEEIEDRGALGSAFTLVHKGKRARIEMSLSGAPCGLERARGHCCGQRMGHRRRGSAKDFSRFAHAFDARRIDSLHEWICFDQRLLQFEPCRTPSHDQPAGGDAGISAAHSRCGRDAGARSEFRAASSRGRRLRGKDRQRGLCHWRAG